MLRPRGAAAAGMPKQLAMKVEQRIVAFALWTSRDRRETSSKETNTELE